MSGWRPVRPGVLRRRDSSKVGAHTGPAGAVELVPDGQPCGHVAEGLVTAGGERW